MPISADDMNRLDESVDSALSEETQTMLRAARMQWAESLRAQGFPIPPEFVETEEAFQYLLAFIRSKSKEEQQ